jgi:hypothetical protein
LIINVSSLMMPVDDELLASSLVPEFLLSRVCCEFGSDEPTPVDEMRKELIATPIDAGAVLLEIEFQVMRKSMLDEWLHVLVDC